MFIWTQQLLSIVNVHMRNLQWLARGISFVPLRFVFAFPEGSHRPAAGQGQLLARAWLHRAGIHFPLYSPHTLFSSFWVPSYPHLSLLLSHLLNHQLTSFLSTPHLQLYLLSFYFIIHTWGPNTAYIIPFSSFLSSQQPWEVDWAELVCVAKGHPINFHERVVIWILVAQIQIWITNYYFNSQFCVRCTSCVVSSCRWLMPGL